MNPLLIRVVPQSGCRRQPEKLSGELERRSRFGSYRLHRMYGVGGTRQGPQIASESTSGDCGSMRTGRPRPAEKLGSVCADQPLKVDLYLRTGPPHERRPLFFPGGKRFMSERVSFPLPELQRQAAHLRTLCPPCKRLPGVREHRRGPAHYSRGSGSGPRMGQRVQPPEAETERQLVLIPNLLE